jgi:phospholipid-transporting ATPase
MHAASCTLHAVVRQVTNRQLFPADLLVLASSDRTGNCYIETAGLDGETNLKIRNSLDETLALDSIEKLQSLQAFVECDLPNNMLYTFNGNLVFPDGRKVPIAPNNMLLRGAALRNTKWILGLVIYTGGDTKVVQNSSAAPSKRSDVEKLVNSCILIIFTLQFCMCVANTVLLSQYAKSEEGSWYLPYMSNLKILDILGDGFVTSLILFNNLVPISLYLSLEFVKLIQTRFIDADLGMYYAPKDTPALARTSNLNEDLGQVTHTHSRVHVRRRAHARRHTSNQ